MMNNYEQIQCIMRMMGKFTDLSSNPFEQFSGFQTDSSTNSKQSNEQKNTYQDPPNSQTTASDKDSTLHSEKHNENPMGNSNMMDLLKSSLTPEQQAMFEMFQHSI